MHKKKGCCNVSVREFGAIGNGIADDTKAFRKAIKKSKSICLPPGKYLISKSLKIPSNRQIYGAGIGASVIITTNNKSYRVLDINGREKIQLNNFSIQKKSGNPNPQEKVNLIGVSIRNGCKDILVDKLHIDGCYRGFDIDNTSDGGQVNERIGFRDCRATHSIPPTKYTGQFGFSIAHCDVLALENCHASEHWLDGVKVLRFTKNVLIKGGSFNSNGVSGRNQSGAGDGLDAYAGGDGLTITDVVFQNNTGNGITIKTGPLNDPSESIFFGYVRNIEVSRVKCIGNRGNGLYVTRDIHQDQPNRKQPPLLSSINVTGGLFENNNCQGIYIRARNVIINAPVIRSNALHGVIIASDSFDVQINNFIILANGTAIPGNYSGIAIQGKKVQVRGGIINGKDHLTDISSETDYPPLPTYHNYGIDISDVAFDIFIDYVSIIHHTNDLDIKNLIRNGSCIINRYGDGIPGPNLYAGPGSIYRRTDSNNGSIYVKETGYDGMGWRALAKV